MTLFLPDIRIVRSSLPLLLHTILPVMVASVSVSVLFWELNDTVPEMLVPVTVPDWSGDMPATVMVCPSTPNGTRRSDNNKESCRCILKIEMKSSNGFFIIVLFFIVVSSFFRYLKLLHLRIIPNLLQHLIAPRYRARFLIVVTSTEGDTVQRAAWRMSDPEGNYSRAPQSPCPAWPFLR